MLRKLFNREPRCKHRHTARTHPHCFIDGVPKDLAKPTLPKVLVFDIETSPLEAYVWQHNVWGGNVSDEQVISQWFMLTWSAKWLFDDKIMSNGLSGKEALAEDDSRIVTELWKLLDEADIVIAHNGDKFDVPNINTRFIVNQLPPPLPYQTIDTLKIARKQFGFTHNSLNALAKVFGLNPKLETDFQLWKQAKNGDDKAIKYMEEYNKGDVELLEDVYMALRPWIRSHPNLGLYVESTEPVCPHCGSTNLQPTGKFYYTQTGKYETYRCECGAFGRARTSSTPKEVRKNLKVSLAR